MRHRSAWRTMNWIRLGGEVFMVQQRWKLYREKLGGDYEEHSAISQEAFPLDEWCIVNLKEQIASEDKQKLLEARQKMEELS